MATVSKAISGANTTYTITDAAGTVGTLVVNSGATTGFATTLAATGMRNDGLSIIAELLAQIRTGVLPGSGAQGIPN